MTQNRPRQNPRGAQIAIGAVCLGAYALIFITPVGGSEPDTGSNPNSKLRTPAGGVYAIICAEGGKFLDAHQPTIENDGCRIQVWSGTGKRNQQWRLTRVSKEKNEFKIECLASGKLLEAAASDHDENGRRLQLAGETGADNQRWRISYLGEGCFEIKNSVSEKQLDLAASETAKDGGTIQLWEKTGKANQQWRLLRDETAPDKETVDLSENQVATVTPVSSHQDGQEMRVVWVDPTRNIDAKNVQLGDLVRFEYPKSRGEKVWSNLLPSGGGIAPLLTPRPDLVYRLYRSEQADSVPKIIRELALQDDPCFWRIRDNNRIPLPLLFVGAPASSEKIDLDAKHQGLSVSVIDSPDDKGVVLSSKDVLILIRARLLVKKDWVAVDLHIYNMYGPPIETPPTPYVRMAGGEQLAVFPTLEVDKIIPDNYTFGELRNVKQTHVIKSEAYARHPIGIGASVGYTFSSAEEVGSLKTYSVIHPLRWELFTKSWSKEPLGEGSFRRGLLLFKPPQAAPFSATSSATVVLRTPSLNEFAYLDYKRLLASDEEIVVPGSIYDAMRYDYAKYSTSDRPK